MRRSILLVFFCLTVATPRLALADPPLPTEQPVPNSTHSLQPIAPWAMPASNSHYVGYYVGGGCACPRRAEGRAVDEGTWGWDYQGWLIPRDIIHGWWHGRYQGGTGAYGTDGPHH